MKNQVLNIVAAFSLTILTVTAFAKPTATCRLIDRGGSKSETWVEFFKTDEGITTDLYVNSRKVLRGVRTEFELSALDPGKVVITLKRKEPTSTGADFYLEMRATGDSYTPSSDLIIDSVLQPVLANALRGNDNPVMSCEDIGIDEFLRWALKKSKTSSKSRFKAMSCRELINNRKNT